jgi:hypothetical protein
MWYAETKLFITVQRNNWRVYGGDVPGMKTIKAWSDKILRTLSVLKQTEVSRRSVSEHKIEEILGAFQRSPSKSIFEASRGLYLSRTTMQRLLRVRLHLSAYRVQITQELKPDDRPKRLDFATDILHRIATDPAQRMHLRLGKLHIHRQVVRHSPEVNVWWAMIKDRIIGPFFFEKATAKGDVYLDVLVEFVYLQVANLAQNIIYRQNGVPHSGV